MTTTTSLMNPRPKPVHKPFNHAAEARVSAVVGKSFMEAEARQRAALIALLNSDGHPFANASLCSIKDACKHTGMTRASLCARAKAGNLRLVKVGSKTLIDVASLKEMLARPLYPL